MAKNKIKAFWLSYDLGLKGDYDSLYTWLDKQKAKECGDNIAFFKFDCKTGNPREEIKNSLLQAVEFGKTDRVYMIWRDDDTQSNAGAFLVGKRKTAPWAGYYTNNDEEALDF